MDEWRLPVSGFGIASGSTSSASAVEGGDGVGNRWLMGLRQVADGLAWVTNFFFGWLVGSVIRGEHGWWSPTWEASLASLLAWG